MVAHVDSMHRNVISFSFQYIGTLNSEVGREKKPSVKISDARPMSANMAGRIKKSDGDDNDDGDDESLLSWEEKEPEDDTVDDSSLMSDREKWSVTCEVRILLRLSHAWWWSSAVVLDVEAKSEDGVVDGEAME